MDGHGALVWGQDDDLTTQVVGKDHIPGAAKDAQRLANHLGRVAKGTLRSLAFGHLADRNIGSSQGMAFGQIHRRHHDRGGCFGTHEQQGEQEYGEAIRMGSSFFMFSFRV